MELVYVVATGLTALGGVVAVLRYRGPRAEAALVYVDVREGSPATAEMVNGSPFAISGLGVAVWEHGRRSRVWRFVGRDRWMTGRRIADVRCPPRLRPGDSFSCDLPSVLAAGANDLPPVTLRFRDGRGRGRQWIVWPDGRVTRLNPSVHWWQHWRRTRWTRRLQEAQSANR
jgi:hypothetical protein